MKNTLHDYHLFPQRASGGQYKRLCLFLLAQLCFLVNGQAQTYPSICATPEPEPEEKRYSACSSTVGDATFAAYNHQNHTWYDAVDNLTPTKTVHLAFVIWHRADGTGGWPNTTASHNLLRAHVKYMSDSIYGANDLASYLPIPSTPLIPDTRVRFVVDTIYHMYNTYYYETSLGWPNSYNIPLYAVAPDAKKTLNIHVIKGDTITYHGAWGWTTGASSSQGSDVSVATKMGAITYMEKSWAGHLAHELAHDVGLGHLYQYGEVCQFSNPDFLFDVFGNTPDPACAPSCDVCPHPSYLTNNIMSGGGPWTTTNFSPLQIGRMHRTLQGMNTRKYTWGRENRPYIITANETWNFNVKVYQDLVIPAGKKLIIKCRVEMVPDARITVEPGGVLEVDGGTITSAVYASVPWQGIEVIGNSLLPQKPVSGGYPQGRLILKNNALIENARNAVTTWKYGDWNSTGGLIQATDATFHNNGRSVEFMAYSHPENSYFANCTFLVDAPLLQGNCMAMVTAWEVKGTRFLGNRFEYIPAGSPDIYPAPKGIYTISAGFSVTPACNYPGPGIPMFCFPTYAKPNTFKGLLHGIEATNGPSKTFKVDSAHFEQCAIGIYASAVNMFEVVRSKFDIKPYYGTITQTGLSNDAGTGFKIQNNSFYSTQPVPLSYKFIGLSSNNTGSALNEVYRNDYKNMFRANTSSMINWAAGASTNVLGLKYKCNKQSVNKRDINISDGTIGQIQGVSGTPNYPAANTFSVTSDPQGHISNSGTNYMIYIYGTGTGETPTLYTSGMVFPVVSSSTTACPSLLSWGGIVIADKEKEFFKAKATFDGVQKEYEAVLAGTGARGAKDSLEGLLAKYAAEWNGAADELIRHYISDSTDAQPDSVAAWVARKGDLAAQVMQADMEAEQQNYTAAMTRARVIKTAYPELPTELITELDTRISYYSLLNGYRSAGREYWNLDTPQQRSLYRFASGGTTAAHSQAKNILAFFYGYIFSRETPVKEETGSKGGGSLARMDQAGQNSLIVSPNPASDQVRLEWTPGKELHRLEIVNLTGVSVFRQDNIPGNQLNIDTRSFPSGIYTGSFSSVNGSDKQVFRLVIQH